MIRRLNEKRKLIGELVKNAKAMIQAGRSQTTRTCGQPSCACHSDRARRHGPNAYLTFRAEGRSGGVYVAPEPLEEAEGAKRAWDEVWQAATRVAGVKPGEMKGGWPTPREARGGR